MNPVPVVYRRISTPLGPLLAARTEKGVCFIEFGDDEKARLSLQVFCKKWLKHGEIAENPEALADVEEQLQEYFSGERRQFQLPLDLYGTPFQKMIWKELMNIPYGETRSYKAIAQAIHAPKAVRAVGGANHCNPVPIVVPCHRVIGSNGDLVGYGGGLQVKQYLLDLEREVVQKGKQE